MGVVETSVGNFFSTEEDTIFHFMCQCEHTQSFWVRLEICLKEKSLNFADFQLIPHWFSSDMTEKQQQMKALTLFFCMQNSLYINADWTNLSLHLKLLQITWTIYMKLVSMYIYANDLWEVY